MDRNKIIEIIDNGANDGISVKMRDIAYAILTRFMEDKEIAYKCLFSAEKDYNPSKCANYDKSATIAYVREKISDLTENEEGDSDISFEENKAYMLKLKRDTEKAMERNEIDKKDGLKILADISVKLNDKFAVQDTSVEQRVVVYSKFNAICKCGREIYVPTKEELMDKYGLIEKDTNDKTSNN